MNPFRQTSQYPSLVTEGDPREYLKMGSEIERGDPRFIMSRSQLMAFDENPWEWIKGKKDDATKEMEWGSLVDCMFTSPTLIHQLYVCYPETYPTSEKPDCEHKPWNLNANFCKEWRNRKEEEGLTCIKAEVFDGAREAHARLMEDSRILHLASISQKQVQVVVEYVDKDTSLVVPFKMMIDLMPDHTDLDNGAFLADLKEVNDLRPYEYEKKIYAQGWHIQAKLYLDGVNAAIGENRYSGFLHVIQKSEEPYAVGRRMLSDEFLKLGEDWYKRALQRYCRCLAEKRWPGIDDENNVPGSPLIDGWRIAQPASWMIV